MLARTCYASYLGSMAEFSSKQHDTLYGTFFPLSMQSAEKLSCSDQPIYEFMPEALGEIEIYSPALAVTRPELSKFWGVPENYDEDFNDGYATAHKVFLLHAEAIGQELPKAHEFVYFPYTYDAGNRFDSSTNFYNQKTKAIAEEDGWFDKAITHQINKDRALMRDKEKRAFILGSIALHDMMGYQLKSLDFSRTFMPSLP